MKIKATCCSCNDMFNISDLPDNEHGLWICDQCSIIINRIIKKKEFIKKCGELLNIAKPNLVKCEYMLGSEVNSNQYERRMMCDEDEFVVVTCENGYTYTINITGNSLNAIAEAIFKAMANK